MKEHHVFCLWRKHDGLKKSIYDNFNVVEHKSFNLLELDNGQYCLYPNNRMRVYDNSLTPKEPKMPDFKVSTEYYQVENGNEYRLGDTDEYFWKEKK